VIAMYQPEHYRVEDVTQMHALIRPFAAFISHGSNGLYATHLPTALLALVAPQRSGSFQDGFICFVYPPAFGRWLYCAWWLCLGSGPCLAPFQRAHVRLSRPITSPPQMSSERVRPRRTNHAPEHSENSITLLPCSTGLIVGICDFRCRGETRQTQLGRDGKTQIGPASETDSGHLDRSHSHQQERLSHRNAGSLWASGNPIQADQTDDSPRIYARCLQPR
jgi:hypothetical protein